MRRPVHLPDLNRYAGTAAVIGGLGAGATEKRVARLERRFNRPGGARLRGPGFTKKRRRKRGK